MELQLNGTTVHYESFGSGIPIIMLHGYTLDNRVMPGCLEPLFAQREGWRRIYLDLPGMGRTPRSEAIRNSDGMLELVLDFIGKVVPAGQPFVLAGQSYGGYLARGVIHRRPERVAGLLLIGPMVIPDRSRRQLPEHQALVQDPDLLSTLTPAEHAEFTSVAVVQNRRVWDRYSVEVCSGSRLADKPYLDRLLVEEWLQRVEVALNEPLA